MEFSLCLSFTIFVSFNMSLKENKKTNIVIESLEKMRTRSTSLVSIDADPLVLNQTETTRKEQNVME